jgi:hypothetical protein
MRIVITIAFMLSICPFVQAENKNDRSISEKLEILQTQPTT